jgi:ribosomal-protein-alanine N-acetyltransferase
MIALLSKDNLLEILALYDGNFDDGWTESQLISAFDSGRFLAFAKRQGQKLIALLTISTTQFDADIEGIVVDKEFRNKGYAIELLDFAQTELKNQGIEKIFLEVRESNFPAINLYKSQGFTQNSIRKKYYQDGENALVMNKEF